VSELREVAEFWQAADPIRWHVLDDRPNTKTTRKFYGTLYAEAVKMLGRVPERIVDWGCGGGMAAQQMMADGTWYYGVDIVQKILDACSLAVKDAPGLFVPVLVDIEHPEACSIDPCDLFLCLTVYQHMPDMAYAERITRLVPGLLKPDGLAIIQTRRGTRKNDGKAYKHRWVNSNPMDAAEFGRMAGDAGLDVVQMWMGENWSNGYDYHFCRRVT
jgi:2-polyprenyl-3-methyl-5-hydroxy-6-metoxy-1,4-benzoquinol methylase